MKRMILILFLSFFAFFPRVSSREKYVKVFFPDGTAVMAELAVSDEERARGLMYREGLNSDLGMLFLFEKEGYHTFWMKNMNFPIDILWLDRDKRIVHIEHSVPPCREDPCPTYGPSIPSEFVLEIISGGAKSHSLKMFDRLEFVLPDAAP